MIDIANGQATQQAAVRVEDRNADGHDVFEQVLVADDIAPFSPLGDAVTNLRGINDTACGPTLNRAR